MLQYLKVIKPSIKLIDVPDNLLILEGREENMNFFPIKGFKGRDPALAPI